MRKYVCDRCLNIIPDDNDMHKFVMAVKDVYSHDEYFQELEFCTNCANESVSTFENFLDDSKKPTNDSKTLTDEEKRILEDMPALRKLAIMAGFEV